MTGSPSSSRVLTDRYGVQLAGLGIVSETAQRGPMTGGTALSSQRVQYVSIGLRVGDVITSAVIFVSGAGVTLTLSKVGLYDSAGTRLALSADQGTAWESTGYKTAPLSAAYTVPADGLYYAAVLAVGATGPTLLRGANLTNFGAAIGSNPRYAAAQDAQADLPATATFGTTVITPWIALI